MEFETLYEKQIGARDGFEIWFTHSKNSAGFNRYDLRLKVNGHFTRRGVNMSEEEFDYLMANICSESNGEITRGARHVGFERLGGMVAIYLRKGETEKWICLTEKEALKLTGAKNETKK